MRPSPGHSVHLFSSVTERSFKYFIDPALGTSFALEAANSSPPSHVVPNLTR